MGTNKGLSAAALKNIAVVTMTIDHVTAFLLKMYLRSQGVASLYSNDWYTLGRVVGRIAFVIYAFMLAEGALKTKNKVKYALRLLILAVVSVVPHSMAGSQKWFDPTDLNIFFLLFTGLITIYAYQFIKEKVRLTWASVILRLIVIAAACTISTVLKFEYGLMGILLIMVFYIFRYNFYLTAVFGTIVMSAGYMLNIIAKAGFVSWWTSNSGHLLRSLWNADKIQFWGILALPLIFFYNGQKGKQLPKWFYYFFYPVHLGIIALIVYLAK